MSTNFVKVKLIEFEDDWYVIPTELSTEFRNDCEDLIDNGFNETDTFNDKWRGYMTDGALNKIQLYILNEPN